MDSKACVVRQCINCELCIIHGSLTLKSVIPFLEVAVIQFQDLFEMFDPVVAKAYYSDLSRNTNISQRTYERTLRQNKRRGAREQTNVCSVYLRVYIPD